MTVTRYFSGVAAAAVVLLSSCATSHTMTYMQDLIAGEKFTAPEAPDLVAKPGDKLKIVVSCKNPQLATPFNIVGGVFSLNMGDNDGNQSSSVRSDDKAGYTVDAEGNIDFPVLGTLHVGDSTLTSIKNMVKGQIVAGNFIKDPIVTVDVINFKYTILGEVGTKGNLEVEDNHINLIQAIANAGDLTTSANYQDVKVIRTHEGTREVYSVNMFSKDLYQSPAFHLQQNDVVYIKPRASKWRQDGERALNLTTVSISLASLVTSICTLCAIYAR